MTYNLQGKTAIVTGAGNGIGFAIASHLSAAGANVVVADIDASAAQEAASKLQNATPFACDVRDEEQVKSLVDLAVETYGGLHIMVPAAGIMTIGSLVDMDLAAWHRGMSINVDGVFLCMSYGARAIIASGGGSIVNISSVTARGGVPFGGSYAASKAAVLNLTKTAAVELRGFGVRVNAVLPGFVATNLVASHTSGFESALGLPPGGFSGLIEQKQQRFGTADEVAKAVMFFISDDASFSTGSELVLDGGFDAGVF